MKWVMRMSKLKYYLPIFIVIVITFFRVYLTSDRDIIATYSPYDEYWYVKNALNGIWGGSYNHMSFVHLPIYSMWLKFNSLAGVPARLAIDYLWVVGALFLSFSVYKLTDNKIASLLCLILILYHPYSFSIFDRGLSETLLTAILLYFVASLILIFGEKGEVGKWVWIVYWISLALAWNIRKEGILLVVPMIVFCLAFLTSKFLNAASFISGYKLFKISVVPLLLALGVGLLIASINYLKWGTFARHELAAPQYSRVINALLSIDSGVPSPRHVGVTKLAREIAYANSPTFLNLKPYFDSSRGKILEKQTSDMDPWLHNEIGDWVFYWALRDAAAGMGWHSSSKNAEAKYKVIADELELAFKEKRIQKRTVITSFLSPEWKVWMPHLTSSVMAEMGLVVSPSVSSGNLGIPTENASAKQFADYSILLGRRKIPMPIEIIGWVTAPAGSSVGIGGEKTPPTLWFFLEGATRPDVLAAYPFSFKGLEPSAEKPKLYVRLQSGEQGSIEFSQLYKGSIVSINSLKNTRLGIEYFDSPSTQLKKSRLDYFSDLIYKKYSISLLEAVSRIWSLIDKLLLVFSIIFIIFSLIRKNNNHINILLISLFSYFFARAILFGIMDAASWYSQASRYMFPAVPFFIASVVIGSENFINDIKLLINRNKKI
jgi:hypothetical protein